MLFTLIVAVLSVRVGVKVITVLALLTDVVYVSVADVKTGLNVPVLSVIADKVASEEASRVTVTV